MPRTKRGQRALGPYAHRDGFRVVEIAADGTRTRLSFASQVEAIAYCDEYNLAAAAVEVTLTEALERYEHHFVVVKGNKPTSWPETKRRILRIVGDANIVLDAVTHRRAQKMYDDLVAAGVGLKDGCSSHPADRAWRRRGPRAGGGGLSATTLASTCTSS